MLDRYFAVETVSETCFPYMPQLSCPSLVSTRMAASPTPDISHVELLNATRSFWTTTLGTIQRDCESGPLY